MRGRTVKDRKDKHRTGQSRIGYDIGRNKQDMI